MRDEITELYKSPEPICEEGREFLCNRSLSIPQALLRGICSKDGIMYFLYTRNGEVVRWKARSMTDKKRQFMSKLDDSEASSFKMPFFSQFKASTSRDLFITEGEFDCVALTQLGATNCVSLPNGAQSVETTFRNNYEFLQQFDRIYICFDMDKPGEDAAKVAMRMIPPNKFRRIIFPEKDANEWLQQNPFLDKPDLQLLMENSRKVENPCLTHMSEVPESFYDKLEFGVPTGFSGLDFQMGGLRKGEVTIITADTGAGKSTFCINLFKQLADKGHSVWINSFEMDPRMTHRKLASAVLQKPLKFENFTFEDKINYRNWLNQSKCYLNIMNSKVDLTVLRNLFEQAVLAHNVEYILLDHLDYIHSAGTKKTALENIDEAVREIHILAMEFQVGVILVAHPKQTQDGHEITMSDIKGSSSIKQYADNIIILTRMERLNPVDINRVKVRVCKNRLIGREGFFFLTYLSDIDGYIER